MAAIETVGGQSVDNTAASGPLLAGDVGRRAARHPRTRLSLLVLVIGLLITGAVTWTVRTDNNRNEDRLLNLQVRSAASVLGGAVTTIQTPLASSIGIADATNGNAAKFDSFIAPYVGPDRPYSAASLWQLSGQGAHLIATVGKPLDIAKSQAAVNLMSAAQHSPRLDVFGLLDHGQRLGYAFGPSSSRYVALAQGALPPGRKVAIPHNSAFSELNFALYLGKSELPSTLLEESASTPFAGRRATSTVPFGDTSLTLVGTPTGALGGSLSRNLAWIVGLLGVVLSIAAALMTEWLVRRRREAERLAAENRRLYGEQRGIAEALQRALLPHELPDIPGIETETRYLAGLKTMDIGGDWYDVIFSDDSQFVFVVGDVSGRGLKAAAIMASLHYAIRAYVAEGDSPDRILTKLGALLKVGRDGHFATVLCGSVDIARGQVTVASAGHFAPLLIRGGEGNYVEIKTAVPIGVGSAVPYHSATFSVAPGSTLLAFTDGLVERRGENLDVGLERLRQAAISDVQSLGDLLDQVVAQLIPEGTDDDTAILGLKWQT